MMRIGVKEERGNRRGESAGYVGIFLCKDNS